MKILQISPAIYPAISIGGPIYTTLGLTRVLAKRHEVMSLTTPLGLDKDQRAGIKYGATVEMEGLGSAVYQRYYGYSNLTFSPASWFWLLRETARYDVVLLEGVWNFPLIAAAWIARKRGVPYVIIPHGTLYRETVELRSGLYKRLLLRLCVRGLLRDATRILFTTEDEAQKVTSYLGMPLRSYTIPNIVEAVDFAELPARGAFRTKHGIRNETHLLIHYGRITRKKGVEFAIRTVAALRAKGLDVVLAIVGGDAEGYGEVLRALISELNVHEGVIFTGIVKREEGKSAMVDADLFLLPSYSENFGMAVVEAMLCGLPVVISNNVGLAPDIAAADVGVVVTLDAEARELTRAVEELLGDKTRRSILSEKAYRFAIENYDTPAIEGRIEALLQQISPTTYSARAL